MKKYYKATFDINVKSGFALLIVLTLCEYFVIISSMINNNLEA